MDPMRELEVLRDRLFDHLIPQVPEERNLPSRPKYEPGFPFEIECTIDPLSGDWDSTQVVHNNMTWSAIWKPYRLNDEMCSAGITLVRLTDDQKVYRVKLAFEAQNVYIDTGITCEDDIILDSTHNSVHIRDFFYFSEAMRRRSVISPVLVTKIIIFSVTEIDTFSYSNQKWPLGHSWLFYDRAGIRMRTSVLNVMNPNFNKVRDDLGNKIMSAKEAEAFYDFASALFNRTFTGTDKYHLALRQGFKFGFTRNWGLFDQNDSDLDFVSRTCLPLFSHLGEETNPPESEQYFNNMRRVTAFGKFKLLNGNPFRRFFVLKPEDVKTQCCQFYIYLETTATGETLLMSGGIFTFTNMEVSDHFLARVQVQFIIGNDVKLDFHAERIIHQRQRTINFVMGVMDAELLSILESDRSQFFVSVTKLDTNVYHIGNYRHLTLEERNKKRESEERRQERQKRRDRGDENVEADSDNEEELSKELVMPGVIDAWLISSDKKRIGVSRVYLSSHSEYFRTKFNDNNFGDCGGDSAQVDEEEEIIWAALQIIYHRSLLIHTDSYHRIASLGDIWLAPIVKRFVEIAMLQSDLISAEEKRETANLYHFDVVKYILRHPEYAKDYDIVFPNGVHRVTAEILDDEIDGGLGKRTRRAPGEPLLRRSPNFNALPPQVAPLVPRVGAAQAALQFPYFGELLPPFIRANPNMQDGLPFMRDRDFADPPGIFEQIDAQMRRREHERAQRAANREGQPQERPRGHYMGIFARYNGESDEEDERYMEVQQRRMDEVVDNMFRMDREEEEMERERLRILARDDDNLNAARERNVQEQEAPRERNEQNQRGRLQHFFADRLGPVLQGERRRRPNVEVIEDDARPPRNGRQGHFFNRRNVRRFEEPLVHHQEERAREVLAGDRPPDAPRREEEREDVEPVVQYFLPNVNFFGRNAQRRNQEPRRNEDPRRRHRFQRCPQPANIRKVGAPPFVNETPVQSASIQRTVAQPIFNRSSVQPIVATNNFIAHPVIDEAVGPQRFRVEEWNFGYRTVIGL